MASSWFNWGFSLIFSAVLAREVARRVDGVDYRALAAASFLGLGSVWAQGLSGSAALQMATPGALQPQIRDIVADGGRGAGRHHPLQPHHLPLAEPRVGRRRDRRRHGGDVAGHAAGRARAGRPRDLGIDLGTSDDDAAAVAGAPTPGEWLEHSPILTWLVVALGGAYLVRYFVQAAEPLNAHQPEHRQPAFLLLGFLLHGTPARLMHAVQAATPAVWGVILQFPFYAGIAGIITGTHLNERLADAVRRRLDARRPFPPSSRSTRRCSACSCRRAARSG